MKTALRVLSIFCLMAISTTIAADDFAKGHIILKTEKSKLSGRIRVVEMKNIYGDSVVVRLHNEFDNQNSDLLLASGQIWKDDKTCTSILAKPKKTPKASFIEIYKFEGASTEVTKKAEETVDDKKKSENAKDSSATTKKNVSESMKPKATARLKKIMAELVAAIDSLPVFSKEQIGKDSSEIMAHIENLRGWSDKDAYIADKDIASLIKSQQDTISYYRNNGAVFVKGLLSHYEIRDTSELSACADSLLYILNSRLSMREANLQPLIEETKDQSIDKNLIGVGIASAIIIIGLLIWYRIAARKTSSKKISTATSSKEDPASLIIIGQRNSPTLKKLSMDDVYNNEAYMKIDCADFCSQSAVRAMYVKNTCVKDIYKMYAEDLRNPNNPKEDGCLVIGRWVQDEATKKYDVSLEYIVTPGDDAIFSEYELNFGGKIQLKKANMLKNLRRSTGLQYDLTCWVHSHPGLGVFFSNSDTNVQMQLKNELHPYFLTALVIDILTPEQETGIFTFRPDGTINSKNDLSKMYSLEELYKWALDSERRSFNKDDYYNTLRTTEKRINDCYGIELSNGAIIDMTYMATNPNGFVALMRGYQIPQGEKQECIVTSVTKSDVVSDNKTIGCFVVSAHCSIPSIRKIVAQYLDKISFVLVYTATDGMVTSIPVQNHDLCNNEEYYGEHLLEDLKIWTRRKR